MTTTTAYSHTPAVSTPLDLMLEALGVALNRMAGSAPDFALIRAAIEAGKAEQGAQHDAEQHAFAAIEAARAGVSARYAQWQREREAGEPF